MIDDIVRKSYYDDSTGKMTNVVTQDVTPYLDDNKAERNARPEIGKYKGNLVKAASIPLVAIEMMANGQCCSDGIKYNLLSHDMDERRRALVHIQTNHKDLLTVNGTPFTKNRIKWQ